MNFPRFRGVIWSIKVVSDFGFGDRKCSFWYPPNPPKCAKVPDFGYQKMGLGVPEIKNGDQFFMATSPQNGGIDVCVASLPLLGGF